jgi:RHS repeat-associated protein
MATPEDRVYCYHFNATGSTIAMTDEEQNIVSKYGYDPFGSIQNQQEDIFNQDTRLVDQPFRFVGQFGVMTEPNGFYYMRARYYDPQVGRFISEDPIGFDGGDVNLYAYANNNPANFVDPSGLCATSWSDELIRRATSADWERINAGAWAIAGAALGTAAAGAVFYVGSVEYAVPFIGPILTLEAIKIGGMILVGSAGLAAIGIDTIHDGWTAGDN